MKPPVLVAVCSSEFVTTTSAVPAVPAGVVATIDVGVTTVTLVAATPPTVTPDEPPGVKFVPVIVMFVASSAEPEDGVTLEIVGAGNASEATPVPVVTVIGEPWPVWEASNRQATYSVDGSTEIHSLVVQS